MRGNAIRTGTCLAAFLFATTAGFAEVTDLQLSKSGNNVALEWTTGTSPYRVIRSLTAVFMSGNTSVAEGGVTGSATDPGALLAAESYFYQVLGADDANPPLYDLNPPRPIPAITMLTPASGQPGTSVTIDGINFADFGSGQIVMFGDQPADVQSSTPTQIIATAPPGTVTSDVGVCVVDVCSNYVRFTVTFGPTFQSIGSLAFEPGTGSLWLGDRGAADHVVEVDSAGTATVRANQADPYVSNVSPGDGSGRVYFSSQGLGVGAIRYINSVDNSNVFFRNAGAAADQVGARALAANDSEFNVAYFLDGNLDRVRRVPQSGAIGYELGQQHFLLQHPFRRAIRWSRQPLCEQHEFHLQDRPESGCDLACWRIHQCLGTGSLRGHGHFRAPRGRRERRSGVSREWGRRKQGDRRQRLERAASGGVL